MKRLTWFAVFCLICGLLVWGVVQGRQEIRADAEADQPVEAPLRAKDGVVTLDAQSRKAAGIEATAIENRQIPASAIVWWQGKSYVYVQKSAGVYVLTAINPNEKTSLTQPVVTTGAQLLLSEELRAGIQIED
ncbi:MAG TPA: hypothetical protein VMV79_01250 [Alphaproteobacteria bacterium]|nr:hypothetical protein [Alphaproteobacteria bacterium]